MPGDKRRITFQIFVVAGNEKYEADRQTWEKRVIEVLSGQKFRTNDRICGQPIWTLLGRCVLLNDVNPKEEGFVPQLPLLRLQAWYVSSPKLKKEVRWAQARLDRLIRDGETLDHFSFERFICSFEELRSWAFTRQKLEIDVEQYWVGAQVAKESSVPQKVNFPTSPCRDHLLLVLPGFLRDLSHCIPFGHFLAARNQPGFDSMHVMCGLVMFVECRYSDPDSTTLLSGRNDVYEKIYRLRRQIKECPVTIGGQLLTEERCVFVTVAHDSQTERGSWQGLSNL